MKENLNWIRLAALVLVAIALVLAGKTVSAQSLHMVPETGHTDKVNSASFSPDGTRIVTASADNTAKVWNAANGKELLSLTGHTDWVMVASFSPDGTRIVTGSLDKTARVWDAATGKELVSLAGHATRVTSAAFSPDGTRIVTADADFTAKVWDATTGKELLTIGGFLSNRDIRSASFSPDGIRIASGSAGTTPTVWDAATGKELLILSGHADAVTSALFSPGGDRIVTGSNDHTAKVWDGATGKELLSLNGHADAVISASFSPDGTRIVTASEDNTARVWSATTGKELLRLKGQVTSASFSPNGKRIVTGSWDGAAKVWDATTGKELLGLKGHSIGLDSASFSPDGTRIVTGSADHTAKVWGTVTGMKFFSLKGHADVVTSASFSPNGTRIVTGSVDHTAKVWSTVTRKESLSLDGHTNSVSSASFSPDGGRIVTASYDDTARVWDAANGRELLSLSLEPHTNHVTSASFSPDGTRIVTGSFEKTAKVWDAATGKELLSLNGHAGAVTSALFSPGGDRIVTGSNDHTAKVWDGATGKELLSLNGHADAVISASFSPDGTRIVTASEDNTARVWSATTGKELLRLKGQVTSASFSPNGKRIVTGSWDGAAKVWDATTGKELYALIAFDDDSWIALAPDGRYDSSDRARPHFGHFVMDLPGKMPEVVDFTQIRTSEFYEPDLVSKIMSGVYAPGAHPLLSQRPFPKVEQQLLASKVKFRVTERFNGGIGEVRILVNGQAKARFAKGTVTSGKWITWDAKGALEKGLTVEVVADNGAETLSSARGNGLNPQSASKAPNRFVGVAIGVKDYLGSVPHLKYAGADAIAVTRAMLALATSIHIKPELFLLTDESVSADLRASVTVMPPTKASFNKVYGQLKAKGQFTPNTLLFMDFSGHGAMVHGQYAYLTQDARSADPLELKSQIGRCVTMEEILSFLNLGLASKRLLVLDTCQAAGAAKQLAETMDLSDLNRGDPERDAEAKTVADWQNRYAVGTQVLMGCPMGASSYEHQRYGHGLLTYSLLYCLRNDDLGNPDDPAGLEVLASRLVTDAVNRTSQFASDVGLNQFAMPMGVTSFPIGMMTKADRQRAINLPDPKPAIGTCSLIDEGGFPVAKFNQDFIAQLEGSARGGTIVHISSAQAPGVWTVTGWYLKRADGKVTLRLRLSRGETQVSLPDTISSEGDAVGDAYKTISNWLSANAKP